ncbi:hypothetical protein CE91St41_13430 [Oscillospiraceae bacterium]|nr:hypothetical protein CE91St40_24110 [Oscillospiraceae bacterium]BDF74454.1 hypothetical protein CE91St41_13430 [Oscillospiraceae bacterium]
MSDIKIFVSHRIDINSELIDNPLYVPVRCGAVFDKENPMGIAGDDTGDNISDRRMSFCEFTVQYWAWKNVEADYYGLCHYRRYLSFAEKYFKTDEFNMVYIPMMLQRDKQRFGLLNSAHMETLISQYDVVTSEYAFVEKIPTPNGRKKTVRELWDAHCGYFFEKGTIEQLLELIDCMAPEYKESAREYLEGTRHRGFNCYVMRKELFVRLCWFQFPIMFEIERKLDTTGYSQTMMRTPAFLGEMMYGIFLYHITTHENWKVKELQLVFFRETDKLKGPLDVARRTLGYEGDKVVRAVVDPLFPKGSERREKLKDIYYGITHAKRRGKAEIEIK